jgi:hypothetical protein
LGSFVLVDGVIDIGKGAGMLMVTISANCPGKKNPEGWWLSIFVPVALYFVCVVRIHSRIGEAMTTRQTKRSGETS